MINLAEVIASLTAKDKKRIHSSTKEYVVIELHTFNVGSWASVKLTNDYNRHKNVSNHCGCILDTDDCALSGIRSMTN